MSDEEILKLFFQNKGSNRVNYNFDLSELTNNFSLFDFIKNGNVACRENIGDDFGGFLVCTPKQYIFGYNSGFGVGPHIASFARTMKDILGGGEITSIDEFTKMGTMCSNKYLCGRLVYENVGLDEYGMPRLTGTLNILVKGNIDSNTFLTFKKFYDDYNNEIRLVCKRSNGRFNVTYFDKDTHKKIESGDLDSIYNYLERHIDNSFTSEEDEVIVGISTNNKALN